MATKLQKLETIKQQIIQAGVTPVLAKGATQLVFGDGNPDADIVFIGEAPGRHEDEQGKPFVGAAGKFLDEMLAAAGLNRSDVYITNIVKYRPQDNRDPLPEEKKEFLPYLQAQLEVIQPKVVVTLGRHSLNCFLPDLQISQVHGQPKRMRLRLHAVDTRVKPGDEPTSAEAHDLTVVILPLFHPAAALYNSGMHQTLLDDFATIPSILKQMTTI